LVQQVISPLDLFAMFEDRTKKESPFQKDFGFDFHFNQSIMIIIIPDASGPLVVDFPFFVSSFSFFPTSLVVIEWLFLTFFLDLKNIDLNEAGEVLDKASAVIRMNTSAAETEAKQRAQLWLGDVKGQRRKTNGARRLFSDWQDYLLPSQVLAGGEGEKNSWWWRGVIVARSCLLDCA